MIDQLKTKICQILGKEMTQTDDVTIKGIDFPCYMLEQLYSDEWIGTNLIHACLTMSDKISVVRFCQCISLDIVDTVKSKPHRRPFQQLARKISEWKESSAAPLVYFCPLIHNGIHFSLLEINELDKKIYHYDSMAPAHVIAGNTDKPTRVCEAALSEFGDLKFVYEEAVSDYYILVL
jgi:Ulp1 protease family, C-terminal catalytic domain